MRALGIVAALALLTLCSCRATPWQWEAPVVDPPMGQLPNNRHLSNWDRYHNGQGPQREAYTHQPRFVKLPPMPVPAAGSTLHEGLQATYNAPTLPESAYTGNPYDVHPAPPHVLKTAACGCGHHGGACLPGAAYGAGAMPGPPGSPCGGPWSPPGIGCPWPADEYICDGGDRNVHVDVLPDWTVRGLDTEDTVAHYDTLRGETVVEPSNRVCIYAPRFAAVRSVKGTVGHRHEVGPLAALDRQMPVQQDVDMIVTTSVQHQQPVGQVGLKPVNIYEQRDIGTLLEKTFIPATAIADLMPHEDFEIMRNGRVLAAEKPRLANALAAAFAWTGKEGVQVVLDGKLPVEASNNVAVEQLYVYDLAGKPALRIVKTASKQYAKPGEIIDFTLRFDNMGTQVIGNVTIIDSLTTRLEYVEGSVQSSVAADFFTQENEGESLQLRWEVVDPLKVGGGGVIRFQARVR